MSGTNAAVKDATTETKPNQKNDTNSLVDRIIGRLKEAKRRFLVGLKRKPQNIPLLAVIVSFIWYSFNLTDITFATTRLQGNNMGLTGFAIMLFSTLAIVCCMNAYPYRKPVNKGMLVLLFIMINIILFCDIHYLLSIADKRFMYSTMEGADKITQTKTVTIVHTILIIITNNLILTLPFYSKWIRKFNTSIEVAEVEEMEAIDISGE